MTSDRYTMDFAIRFSNRDAVTKATMRKLTEELIRQNAFEGSHSKEVSITDSTGKDFIFTISSDIKWVWGYTNDFSIEYASLETEGVTSKCVCTTYIVDWASRKHDKLDYENDDYHVSVER